MRARPPTNPAFRAAGLRARSTAPPEVQPPGLPVPPEASGLIGSFRSHQRLPGPGLRDSVLPGRDGLGAVSAGRSGTPPPPPNLLASAPRFQALSQGACSFSRRGSSGLPAGDPAALWDCSEEPPDCSYPGSQNLDQKDLLGITVLEWGEDGKPACAFDKRLPHWITFKLPRDLLQRLGPPLALGPSCPPALSWLSPALAPSALNGPWSPESSVFLQPRGDPVSSSCNLFPAPSGCSPVTRRSQTHLEAPSSWPLSPAACHAQASVTSWAREPTPMAGRSHVALSPWPGPCWPQLLGNLWRGVLVGSAGGWAARPRATVRVLAPRWPDK
ncbi:uncharacterized protein [Kogia breviceps]|uniref:uncharacterized protein n=1 Tax=Kogia breviceps TaxID=27615 RepID=UPI0034D2CD0E